MPLHTPAQPRKGTLTAPPRPHDLNDDAIEAPEPVPAVPTYMLTAFTVAAAAAVVLAGLAIWIGHHGVALAITVTALFGMCAYQAAVIAKQRRVISHLVLSLDGLTAVTAPATVTPHDREPVHQ